MTFPKPVVISHFSKSLFFFWSFKNACLFKFINLHPQQPNKLIGSFRTFPGLLNWFYFLCAKEMSIDHNLLSPPHDMNTIFSQCCLYVNKRAFNSDLCRVESLTETHLVRLRLFSCTSVFFNDLDNILNCH